MSFFTDIFKREGQGMNYKIGNTVGVDDNGTFRVWKIIDIVEGNYVAMAVANMLDDCSTVPNGTLALRTEGNLKSFTLMNDTGFKTPSLKNRAKLETKSSYSDSRERIPTQYKIEKTYNIGRGFYLIRFNNHHEERIRGTLGVDSFNDVESHIYN